MMMTAFRKALEAEVYLVAIAAVVADLTVDSVEGFGRPSSSLSTAAVGSP